MQELILELDKDNQYEPTKNIGHTLWILEYFLHDIRISSIPFYIEWALDQTQIYLGQTNTTETNKKNSIILINFIFSNEPGGGPFFEISINQFVKLLKEWEKLVKAKTKKIIITQSDDGIIIIKGE